MGRILIIGALIMALGWAGTSPAVAQSRSSREEQNSARAEMLAGRNLPIREIERRILPQMRGDEYLGFEYDPVAQAYRLRFIRNGQVIFVDVDAQTARVLRISR